MNIWANTVITDKGLALQAKLISGTTLEITRAVTAAGYVTSGMLTKQTDVTSPKQNLKFKTITYPEPGKCAVSLTLSNEGVTEGYTAMQVGVYATDPDEGEILYFITQAEVGTGTIVPAETEMGNYNAEWTFYFQYGQADGVTVTVDPVNTVSRTEMEEYIATVFVPITTALDDKADKDLSNIEDSAFLEKAQAAGASGTPVVAATSTDGVTYTATVSGMTALTVGKPFIIIPDKTSTTATPKLNVNDLGEKSLRQGLSTSTGATVEGPSDTWLSANKPVEVMWDGLFFRVNITRQSANNLYGTLPVSKGGTGATTAEEALTNLGAAPAYTYGTDDLTAGTSELETGKLYLVYE